MPCLFLDPLLGKVLFGAFWAMCFSPPSGPPPSAMTAYSAALPSDLCCHAVVSVRPWLRRRAMGKSSHVTNGLAPRAFSWRKLPSVRAARQCFTPPPPVAMAASPRFPCYLRRSRLSISLSQHLLGQRTKHLLSSEQNQNTALLGRVALSPWTPQHQQYRRGSA